MWIGDSRFTNGTPQKIFVLKQGRMTAQKNVLKGPQPKGVEPTCPALESISLVMLVMYSPMQEL